MPLDAPWVVVILFPYCYFLTPSVLKAANLAEIALALIPPAFFLGFVSCEMMLLLTLMSSLGEEIGEEELRLVVTGTSPSNYFLSGEGG